MVNKLLGNVNFALFVVGFVCLVGGVSQWSGPLAAVVAGGVLMSVAAAPFVRRKG